jgi:5-methylcytosine-specific restriction endonuclease McrA
MCASCGSVENLEFDHYPQRTTVVLAFLSRWTRLRHYEQEAIRGNLRLLCVHCNRSSGGCVGNVALGRICAEPNGVVPF